ncbi:MAG: hypothetical protein ABH969_05030 [Pseudomonadota bacterium]
MLAHCREYSAADRGTPGAALNFGIPLTADLVAGRGDGLTLANRAAAGSIQAIPFFKYEATSFALSRLHAKFFRMGRFGNMLEVVKNLALPDPEQLGDFPQIE